MLATRKSKTLETRRQYQRILCSLERASERMFADGMMTTKPEMPLRRVLAFLHIEPSLAEASARMYKAALFWMLSNDHSDASFDAKALLHPEPGPDEMAREDRIKQLRRQNARLRPRGAQQKAKSLSAPDRATIFEALMANKKSSHAVPAAIWFLAGTITGLRPCEWESAYLTSENKLCLLNAKVSNGRSFGSKRSQDLNLLSESDIAIVVKHINNVRSSISLGSGYQSFYNACRDILRRTCDSIWPGRSRHPSLYTARHIFAADAKSSFSKEIVAALLGHGSMESASRYYAHSRTGSGNLMVQPSEEDVHAVRMRNEISDTPPDKGKTKT